MFTDLDLTRWQSVLTPCPSIVLPRPEAELTFEEEIAARYATGQIAASYTSSGVWEVFQTRLGDDREGNASLIVPYQVGLSVHQYREDPRKRYIRGPGVTKPSHYEILSYLGLAAFVSWRTIFALIDTDTNSHGKLLGTYGPLVGLYLRTKAGGIMKVTIMRSEVAGKYIYYMDNPIVPNIFRAGVLDYGVKTIFAQART